MTILFPYTIFLVAAFSLYIIFELSSVESLFTVICSVIIFMYIFALFDSIKLCTYVVDIIAIILLIFAIVIIFKQKTKIIDIVKGFFSPSLVSIIISVLLFTALTINVRLIAWDDSTHWGLAVKVLYTLNGFPKETGILGPQTFALPLFNCFIVNLAGYKEGFMLSGLWLFTWTCLFLPLSKIKWKEYRLIALYSFFCYAIIILSRPVDALSLMMDAVLGIMPAGIITYYFLNKKSDFKIFPVLFVGLFVLSQLKRVFGIIFTLIVIIIISYDLFATKKSESSSRNKYIYAGLLFAPVISIVINALAKPNNISDSTNLISGNWNQMIPGLISTLKSPFGITLMLLAILSVGIVIYFRNKNQRYFIGGISMIAFSVIALCGYFFLHLDSSSKILINAFIKNLLSITIYNIEGYKLVGLILAVYYVILTLCISNQFKNKFKKYGFLLMFLAASYLMCLLFAYSQFSEYEAMNSSSLDRYLLSYIIFSCLSAIILLLYYKPFWKAKISLNKFIISIVLITIMIFPNPFYLYNYQKTSPFETSLLGGIEYNSNRIIAQTEENSKIYLITQSDTGFIAHWTKYNIFPRKVNTSANSIGPAKYENDIWSVDYSIDYWTNILIENEYTHLYIVDIDEYFSEAFKDMFMSDIPINAGVLYEIEKIDEDKVLFNIPSE